MNKQTESIIRKRSDAEQAASRGKGSQQGSMIKTLSRRSFRNNKRRNLVAVLAIILTTMMFTTLFTLAQSLGRNMTEMYLRQSGTTAHTSTKSITDEEIEKIAAHPLVVHSGYSIILGNAQNTSLAGRQVEIRYASDQYARDSFAWPETGRMPEAEDEIALDTLTLQRLGVTQELGAAITLEWQKDMSDNKEFLNMVKGDLDLFSDSVYCFTPSGDVKNLPSGSTPIDFAYSIHSAVGNKMVGARVNGKLVNIDYVIQNGDQVEVITSQNCKGPSRDWLNIVKSTQAKNKINQWFKTELKEDNILRGKEMVDRYCKAKGIVYSDINKPEYQDKVMKRYAFRDWESVLASIGHGGLKEGQVINKMVDERAKKMKKEVTDTTILNDIEDMSNKLPVNKHSKSGIVVKGIHDLAVRFSKCCSPVPGDEIVGFVTRGRGISIHRTDCVNVINLPEDERSRLIDAEWQTPEGDDTKERYSTEIKIYANNRIGMFVDISKVFTERQIDITSMNSRTNKQGKATITMTFDIHGVEELNRLTDKLRQIEGVIDIERTAG